MKHLKEQATQHITQLDVWTAGTRVGGLVMDGRGVIWFAYDAGWVERGQPLSPMKQFALSTTPFKASSAVFDQLHGVFNDALPDGWGLLLMDRYLKAAAGWSPHEITPLDRLAYIGARAMGALEFRPVIKHHEAQTELSLDQLAEEALLVQEGSAADVLGAMYLYGGSPGGARPKVTVAMERGGQACMSGFADIPDNFEHWIVKYRSKDGDPESMGRIELAYARMAQAAGLAMPPTQLVHANVRGKQEDYFAVQRFDRIGNQRLHVISLGGMLELTHRAPSIDYSNLLKAVSFATKDQREVSKAFRLMVFNVLAHNKDDHVKNFAFMQVGKDFVLTPAFDLTFSTGINNMHTTAIGGEGRPGLAAVRRVAQELGIDKADAIIEQVLEAVSGWRGFAAELQVPAAVAGDYWRAISGEPCFEELAAGKH
ncbi:MAG: type II toxin-antitoxin system HipA family toxin [Candidatus Saccharibacteria bacterium]|nr:type II toxin-antitoxin system HipA family toxin [Rhodoferax sp.]